MPNETPTTRDRTQDLDRPASERLIRLKFVSAAQKVGLRLWQLPEAMHARGIARLSPIAQQDSEIPQRIAACSHIPEITGLDGEETAMGFSIRHNGLDFAPSALETAEVPHRVVVDLGVSGLSTQVLSERLRAVAIMADENGVGENETEQKSTKLLS